MPEENLKDDLTGFYLRKALFTSLEKLVNNAAATKRSFSLLLFDLDHFKRFNDKFGHPFGDEILRYMSSTLRLSLAEKNCYFFRYGGDEILVAVPKSTAREAFSMASHFKHNMAHRSFIFRGKIVKITVSAGIASFPVDGTSAEELIGKADEALYFSKRHGRNTITLSGKIKHLRIRNTFIIVGINCALFLSLIAAYNTFLKEPIFKAIEAINPIKVSRSSSRLDRVTLKDGTILIGQITNETFQTVDINIFSEKGMTVTVNLKKSEIDRIKYGVKSQSRRK